jgi:hypothetical protein
MCRQAFWDRSEYDGAAEVRWRDLAHQRSGDTSHWVRLGRSRPELLAPNFRIFTHCRVLSSSGGRLVIGDGLLLEFSFHRFILFAGSEPT